MVEPPGIAPGSSPLITRAFISIVRRTGPHRYGRNGGRVKEGSQRSPMQRSKVSPSNASGFRRRPTKNATDQAIGGVIGHESRSALSGVDGLATRTQGSPQTADAQDHQSPRGGLGHGNPTEIIAGVSAVLRVKHFEFISAGLIGVPE